MFIRHKKGWEIPEREATPEALFFNRRGLMKSAVATGVLLASGGLAEAGFFSSNEAPAAPDPSLGLYPAKRNEMPSRSIARSRRKPSNAHTIISTNSA